MAQDVFRGFDGEQPGRGVPLSGAGNRGDGRRPWPEDEWDGGEEALDALVAQVDAGRYDAPPEDPIEELLGWIADAAAGFAPGGMAEGMGPGPVLAALVYGAAGEDGKGLAALTGDQLLGLAAAARRLESRAAWTQLAAVAEFAARRAAGPPGPAQFAADELAAELGLTWQAAADQMAYASALAVRLPRTFAALAAGKIHPVHLHIIEDETRVLSDADAAQADQELAQAAPGMTWGQLRYAAHRLVLRLDPDSARRRKEAARNDAHVRPFREQSGNGGMIGRELPADEVLASWQHVEQRALDLRAAGMAGSLRELRVRAWLDLLQERDSRSTLAAQSGAGFADAGPEDGSPDAGSGQGVSGPSGSGGDSGPSGSRPAGTCPHGAAGGNTSPSLAALVTITVPLGTVVGHSAAPADVAGFGLADPDTARDLLAAAIRDSRTRWCVTALHPDGTAAAHGCAAGRHHPPAPGGPGPPGPGAAEFLAGLKIRLRPVIRGPCDHGQAEDGCRPSRALAHLVRARTARCAAPGCSRPAGRCDLDHTTAWENGGRTCQCDLAPLCRHHHRCKQAEGWSLQQPEPGVLVWRTPAGRTHITTPTVYDV
ncbi:MAG: DUF222 domain-containing protein [Streptosporangiaceae bacterium]|nr:DUF222 domain-containing protein [Streptosporangiaceae bacterium]